MKNLKRNWKIFVIHHSHTDIGYTDRQEKITQQQVDYIRQAIEIIEQARTGKRTEWSGFKWTCETYWAVEQFWKQADPDLRERFLECLRAGEIGLSGTYLNLTELPDAELLQSVLRRAVRFGRSAGIAVESAMTADINGYGWGYAQCLADAGIRHLMSCLHTHHGMFPLGRKQIPFWWETPNGDRLLVWNGDHYNLGNVLGIAPKALSNYLVWDEFDAPEIAENHWEIAKTRIVRYLGQLEKEDYPYDFVPVAVSGLITDNAPPNGAIMQFIKQWNEKHGERVLLEMTTLDPFFRHLKAQTADIPVYRGDWPDWWSDGVNSTALHTKLFREAQRTLRLIQRLDPDHNIVSEEGIREIEDQLIMYAEHTWGYHSSISEPWHPYVQALEARKQAYSAHAHRLAHAGLDRVLLESGEAMLAAERPMRYRIVNPHPYPFMGQTPIYVSGFEGPLLKDGFRVLDEEDGNVLPHQLENVSRGNQITLPVSLRPGEEKTVHIVPERTPKEKTIQSFVLIGSDRIHDLRDFVPNDLPIRVKETFIESPFVKIQWEREEGIVSWLDKKTGRHLLRGDKKYGAFMPVYERTPTPYEKDAMLHQRRIMGRNRKGFEVERSFGRLVGARPLACGPLYGTVELRYEMKGTGYFTLLLTVYSDSPRVDISVRFLKESNWEPENVYLYLPFGDESRSRSRLRIEKAGILFEPGTEQLPGTSLDYYCIQEGVVYSEDAYAIAIAISDAPMIQLGPLEFGERTLHGQQGEKETNAHLYSWVLSNYWETNFKATLGGFYEFRYSVEWGSHLQTPEEAIALCHAMNLGCVGYRIGGTPRS